MSDQTDWLDALEQRVHQAAERLRALAEDNARLSARAAELERELDAERAARAAAAAAVGDADAGDAARWRRERDEVRKRVEKLATRLGELLAAAGD